jgi:hypothetical protein
MPEAGKSTKDRKVHHIVEAAQVQVLAHAAKVRERGVAGVTSQTEIHCFAAVLVGTRIVVRRAD